MPKPTTDPQTVRRAESPPILRIDSAHYRGTLAEVGYCGVTFIGEYPSPWIAFGTEDLETRRPGGPSPRQRVLDRAKAASEHQLQHAPELQHAPGCGPPPRGCSPDCTFARDHLARADPGDMWLVVFDRDGEVFRILAAHAIVRYRAAEAHAVDREELVELHDELKRDLLDDSERETLRDTGQDRRLAADVKKRDTVARLASALSLEREEAKPVERAREYNASLVLDGED